MVSEKGRRRKRKQRRETGKGEDKMKKRGKKWSKREK